VAIRAHLDDKGLTVAGKSRALVALDRLLGGVIGIPAEFFEGIRRRAELKGEEREQFIKNQTFQHVSTLSFSKEIGQLAMQRSIAEEIRKQINREGVFIESVEALRDIPEPTASDHDRSPETLAEDWINVFSAFAEKASSERLQQLWGRILSGEIRKPGSYSLSTLRVISEMDAEIATTFQEIVVFRLNGGLLLKPKKLAGNTLVKWTTLEEAGLLQDVNGTLGIDTVVEGASFDQPKRIIRVSTADYGLLLTFVSYTTPFRLDLIKITRAGHQICEILPWDQLGTLRLIASSIEKNIGVDIVRILSKDADIINYEAFENINPSPTQPTLPPNMDKSEAI